MSVRRNKEIDPSIQPGSPQPGEPVYLMIGKLRRPHGVKGELSLELTSEQPEKITSGMSVFIGKKKLAVKISQLRSANKFWLVSFEGYEDCEHVDGFRNQFLYTRTEDSPPLPTGRYYHHEIIGLKVYSETHEPLGVVSEILVTGANDVYVVRNENGSEVLLPAIKSVILEIDRGAGIMLVNQQEWL